MNTIKYCEEYWEDTEYWRWKKNWLILIILRPKLRTNCSWRGTGYPQQEIASVAFWNPRWFGSRGTSQTFFPAGFYRHHPGSISDKIISLNERLFIQKTKNMCGCWYWLMRAVTPACSFFIPPLDSAHAHGQRCAHVHTHIPKHEYQLMNSTHFAWGCSCTLITHRSVHTHGWWIRPQDTR